MKCDQFKVLALTDYMDGEASGAVKTDFDEHRTACSSCSEMLRDLQKVSAETFPAASVAMPPERVWRGIREELNRERGQRSVKNFQPDWYERVREWLSPARLSIMMPVLAVALFFVLVPGQSPVGEYSAAKTYLMNRLEPVVSGVSSSDQETDTLGTVIEEFFL